VALTARLTDDANNVIKLLVDSAPAKAALQAHQAERTLSRRGLIAQIKALEAAYRKFQPQLEAAAAVAMARLKDAEAALLAAQNGANHALAAKSSAAYTYTAQRDRLERQLRAKAPTLCSPRFIRTCWTSSNAPASSLPFSTLRRPPTL